MNKSKRWRGVSLTLSEDIYELAMRHVEHMRWSADESNAYERQEEGDDDWLDSSGWKLSDTLEEALSTGTGSLGKGETIQDRIIAGLEAMAAEYDLETSDPCQDDGADDVFAEG